MSISSRSAGLELLSKISDRFGIDGLVGVEISARFDGAVRMKIDRFVGIDELSDYMPELESGSIAGTTTVEVDESTRVTFQV